MMSPEDQALIDVLPVRIFIVSDRLSKLYGPHRDFITFVPENPEYLAGYSGQQTLIFLLPNNLKMLHGRRNQDQELREVINGYRGTNRVIVAELEKYFEP